MAEETRCAYRWLVLFRCFQEYSKRLPYLIYITRFGFLLPMYYVRSCYVHETAENVTCVQMIALMWTDALHRRGPNAALLVCMCVQLTLWDYFVYVSIIHT